MVKPVTVTIDVERWREHVCVACETRLRYRIRRKGTGAGATHQEAARDAQYDAEAKMSDVIQPVPCPCCGIVQPEMTAQRQGRILSVAVVAGLATVSAAFVAGVAQWLTIPQSVAVATLSLALVTLTYWGGARWSANRNLRANKARAQALLNQGVLCGDYDPNTIVDLGQRERRAMRSVHRYGLLVLLACIVLAFLPEGVRLLCGWRSNNRWYPNVIGPGDRATLHLHSKLTCVGGMWKGKQVGAIVENSEEIGIEALRLRGYTKTSQWGRTIEGRFIENYSVSPWITVYVPDNGRLAGADLELHITALLTYPFEVESDMANEANGFTQLEETLSEPATLLLSDDSHAGLFYLRTWLAGQSFSIAMIVLVGFTFVGTTRVLRSRPTTLHATPFEEADIQTTDYDVVEVKRLELDP